MNDTIKDTHTALQNLDSSFKLAVIKGLLDHLSGEWKEVETLSMEIQNKITANEDDRLVAEIVGSPKQRESMPRRNIAANNTTTRRKKLSTQQLLRLLPLPLQRTVPEQKDVRP